MLKYLKHPATWFINAAVTRCLFVRDDHFHTPKYPCCHDVQRHTCHLVALTYGDFNQVGNLSEPGEEQTRTQ